MDVDACDHSDSSGTSSRAVPLHALRLIRQSGRGLSRISMHMWPERFDLVKRTCRAGQLPKAFNIMGTGVANSGKTWKCRSMQALDLLTEI